MTATRRLTRTLHGLDVDPVSMPISGSERVAHRRRRRRRVRGLSRIAARGWRSAPSGTARAFRPMATRQTISVIRSQTGGCLTEPGPRAVPGSLGRSGNYHGRVAPTCFREERMDKPRIFLGSSGKQEKLLQALTRGLEAVAHVDPWTTSFHPGTTTLDRLLELAHEVDFAAFAFARDDWTTSSPSASPRTGSGQASPRDKMAACQRDTGVKRRRRRRSLRASSTIGRANGPYTRTRRSWTGRGRSGWSPPSARPGTSRPVRTRTRK